MLDGIIISSSSHHHLPIIIVIIWQWAWQGWGWAVLSAQRRDPSREKGPLQGHFTGLARLSRLWGGALDQGIESRRPLGKEPVLKRKAGGWGGAVSLPTMGWDAVAPSKEFACDAGGAKDVGSIPGSGRSLEEEMATRSSILAWRIP